MLLIKIVIIQHSLVVIEKSREMRKSKKFFFITYQTLGAMIFWAVIGSAYWAYKNYKVDKDAEIYYQAYRAAMVELQQKSQDHHKLAGVFIDCMDENPTDFDHNECLFPYMDHPAYTRVKSDIFIIGSIDVYADLRKQYPKKGW